MWNETNSAIVIGAWAWCGEKCTHCSNIVEWNPSGYGVVFMKKSLDRWETLPCCRKCVKDCGDERLLNMIDTFGNRDD